MRRVASLLLWLVLLEGLWTMLVGTTQSTELVAGVIAAGVGAALAETMRTMGLLRFRTDPRLLVQAWKLPWQIVFDFAVMTWVLVRSLAHGRRVRGEWLVVPFPTSTGAQARWQRAFAATVGTATPNAIVVDLDRGEAMLHSLEPRVPTGRKAV